MKKKDAIKLFGGRVKDLASALGVTGSAVSQWGEELTQEQEDRVIGAAVRLGMYVCVEPRRERAA
jgi:hypothetical protein